MIIVNLKGGLGNQMFQYALGWVLAKKNKTNLKVDLRFYEEFNKRMLPGYTPRSYSLDLFNIIANRPSFFNLALFGLNNHEHSKRELKCKYLVISIMYLGIDWLSRQYGENCL
jgi:hypothetical protein